MTLRREELMELARIVDLVGWAIAYPDQDDADGFVIGTRGYITNTINSATAMRHTMETNAGGAALALRTETERRRDALRGLRSLVAKLSPKDRKNGAVYPKFKKLDGLELLEELMHADPIGFAAATARLTYRMIARDKDARAKKEKR